VASLFFGVRFLLGETRDADEASPPSHADRESDRRLSSSRMASPGLTNQKKDFLMDRDARVSVAYLEMDHVVCRND
jgi:hypothetical protein